MLGSYWAPMTAQTWEAYGNRFPAFTTIGGYPLIYTVYRSGKIFCADCANTEWEEDREYLRPPEKWGATVYWEGPDYACDGCQFPIASAYGDPDAEDGEE